MRLAMRGRDPLDRHQRVSARHAVRDGLLAILAAASPLGCASVAGVPVTPGDAVTSASGAYSLTLMLPGWERVPVERSAFRDADLVLRHPEGSLDVVVHVDRDADATIDETVLTRREILGEEQTVLAFEEERSFLPGPDYAALSIARYRLAGIGGWVPVLAGTARSKDAVIEILAFGGAAPLNESLFDDLVGGLDVAGGSESRP
jgi:hypothetical protein